LLNDNLDFEFPKNITIDDILENPEDFANAIIEKEYARAVPKIIEAYKIGKIFASENRGIVLDGEIRLYPNKDLVDEKLPPKYQYGDTLNHKNQLCNNCKFYLVTKTGEEYCSFWDANVKEQYWCAKWKGLKDG
tara:strand:+ start:9540 stop:9941 length:402 start_codon:yes stop_codon:yes gene_type:complete